MPEASPEQREQEFEGFPLTRSEYISAVVHLYRGELERANTWRIRLDTTTNWAIVSTIGILSFAFGDAGHASASIILGMYLVVNFLVLEARRYRYFDVWKNRVRMIEENFYTPLLRRDLVSPKERCPTSDPLGARHTGLRALPPSPRGLTMRVKSTTILLWMS